MLNIVFSCTRRSTGSPTTMLTTARWSRKGRVQVWRHVLYPDFSVGVNPTLSGFRRIGSNAFDANHDFRLHNDEAANPWFCNDPTRSWEFLCGSDILQWSCSGSCTVNDLDLTGSGFESTRNQTFKYTGNIRVYSFNDLKIRIPYCTAERTVLFWLGCLSFSLENCVFENDVFFSTNSLLKMTFS